MKKIIMMLMMVVTANGLKAQDIQIKKFERNYRNLLASTNMVYDQSGEACAVIRFFARNTNFIIEPNMGIMRQEKKTGEIRLWVPKGTKRLTIRKKGLLPLAGYEIPIAIEPKVTYEAELSIADGANKRHNVYAGIGYNLLSISGPSVKMGFDIKRHVIELGAIIGMNKTDELYFYGNTGSIAGAYEYKATRIQLRYGYDIMITDFFSVMPQIGGAYNLFYGNELIKGKYDSANSVSAIAAVRLVTSFSNRFKLHITPEYDICMDKNYNCQLLYQYDFKFKSWTQGFNLNIELAYYF